MENATIRGLYGSDLKKSKCVGYCKFHHVCLTAKTMRNHECLNKCCKALKKYEDHPYWTQRERLKEIKKARCVVK